MFLLHKMKNYREENLLKIVKEIARENLSSENVDIKFGKGSDKCDGFMAEILTVELTDEETQKSLSLIAKISLKDERVRTYTAVAEGYKNEVLAYKEIFPEFEEMRRHFEIHTPIKSLVKFYHASETDTEEIIIMENIKETGFKMLPIRELLNQQHVELIFKTFGEIHGSSMALRAWNPEKFQEITKKNVNFFRALLDMGVAEDIIYNMVTIRDVMKEKGFEHFLLGKYAEDSIGTMKRFMDYSEEKYVCFTHVDCWSNNMMFKYEMKNGVQTLSGLKLLDWQAWTLGPPVIDLMFCLFSSCSEEVFNNLQSNIKLYHDSLSRTLALYKLEVEEIYPFEEMMRQFRHYYHFPVMFGMMIRKIRSIDDTDKAAISSDEDSTAIDAFRKAKFDNDYLFWSTKCVLDNVDKMTNKEYYL